MFADSACGGPDSRFRSQAPDPKRVRRLGEIATSPYPSGSPYNDPSIQPFPFDLDAARKLLKEAGWEDSNGDGLVDKQLAAGDKQRTAFEFSFMIHSARKENAIAASILREDLLKIA